MTLVLDAAQAAAIRQHGEADYPHEACGLMGGAVDGDRTVIVQLVPLANQRTDAAHNRYLIDPDAFRGAQATLDRCRAAGMRVVRSTVPMEEWPAPASKVER